MVAEDWVREAEHVRIERVVPESAVADEFAARDVARPMVVTSGAPLHLGLVCVRARSSVVAPDGCHSASDLESSARAP
jgi:hypothetical protein